MTYVCCWNKMLTFSCALANGHIMLNTPVLVRSLKLSNIEPSQYLDGWPPGNTGCCWLHFLFFCKVFFFSINENWWKNGEKYVLYVQFFLFFSHFSEFIYFSRRFSLKMPWFKGKKSEKIKKNFFFIYHVPGYMDLKKSCTYGTWENIFFWFFHRKNYGSLQKINSQDNVIILALYTNIHRKNCGSKILDKLS